MADVWREFPSDPGLLGAAMAEHVAHHAPLQSVLLQQQLHASMAGACEHQIRPLPYVENRGWTWLKHVLQVGFVASVLALVVVGGSAPAMAIAYVVTGLLLMLTIVVVDQQRFIERDPRFELVELIEPERRSEPVVEAPVLNPLTPLMQQMQVAMPERVSVT